MGGAVAIAIQILTALPELISATEEVINMIKDTNNALKQMQKENREPTAAEWARVNDTIDAQMAKLRA